MGNASMQHDFEELCRLTKEISESLAKAKAAFDMVSVPPEEEWESLTGTVPEAMALYKRFCSQAEPLLTKEELSSAKGSATCIYNLINEREKRILMDFMSITSSRDKYAEALQPLKDKAFGLLSSLSDNSKPNVSFYSDFLKVINTDDENAKDEIMESDSFSKKVSPVVYNGLAKGVYCIRKDEPVKAPDPEELAEAAANQTNRTTPEQLPQDETAGGDYIVPGTGEIPDSEETVTADKPSKYEVGITNLKNAVTEGKGAHRRISRTGRCLQCLVTLFSLTGLLSREQLETHLEPVDADTGGNMLDTLDKYSDKGYFRIFNHDNRPIYGLSRDFAQLIANKKYNKTSYYTGQTQVADKLFWDVKNVIYMNSKVSKELLDEIIRYNDNAIRLLALSDKALKPVISNIDNSYYCFVYDTQNNKKYQLQTSDDLLLVEADGVIFIEGHVPQVLPEGKEAFVLKTDGLYAMDTDKKLTRVYPEKEGPDDPNDPDGGGASTPSQNDPDIHQENASSQREEENANEQVASIDASEAPCGDISLQADDTEIKTETSGGFMPTEEVLPDQTVENAQELLDEDSDETPTDDDLAEIITALARGNFEFIEQKYQKPLNTDAAPDSPVIQAFLLAKTGRKLKGKTKCAELFRALRLATGLKSGSDDPYTYEHLKKVMESGVDPELKLAACLQSFIHVHKTKNVNLQKQLPTIDFGASFGNYSDINPLWDELRNNSFYLDPDNILLAKRQQEYGQRKEELIKRAIAFNNQQLIEIQVKYLGSGTEFWNVIDQISKWNKKNTQIFSEPLKELCKNDNSPDESRIIKYIGQSWPQNTGKKFTAEAKKSKNVRSLVKIISEGLELMAEWLDFIREPEPENDATADLADSSSFLKA